MSIKPVGLTIANLDGSNGNFVSINLDGKTLSAIPDTHRVVSVEDLARFEALLRSAGFKTAPKTLQSIIEDKPCSKS